MNKRFNKIISVLLSVCFVLSVCTIPASADVAEREYYVINGGTSDESQRKL